MTPMVLGVMQDWIQRMIDMVNEVLPHGLRITITVTHALCPDSTHDTLAEALAEQAFLDREEAEAQARDQEIERRLDATFRTGVAA